MPEQVVGTLRSPVLAVTWPELKFRAGGYALELGPGEDSRIGCVCSGRLCGVVVSNGVLLERYII